MKNRLPTVIFIFILFSILSCDSHLRIEKRRYTKGFYVSSFGINKKPIDLQKNILINEADTGRVILKQSVENSNEEKIVDQKSYNNAPVLLSVNNKVSVEKYQSLNKTNKVSSTKCKVESNQIKGTTAVANTQNEKQSNRLGWWCALIAAGFTAASMWGFRNREKISFLKLQYWSFKNKWKARALIILIRCGVMFTAFATGTKMYFDGFTLSDKTFTVLTVCYVLGYLFYPKRKKTIADYFPSMRKKSSSLLINVSGLLLCATLGNKIANENAHHINALNHINKKCALMVASFPHFFSSASEINSIPLIASDTCDLIVLKSNETIRATINEINSTTIVYRDCGDRLGFEKTINKSKVESITYANGIKKTMPELKEELKEYLTDNPVTKPNEKKEKKGALQIFLYIISIISLVILELAVAVMTCVLTCNGQGGAAVLVAIGGTLLIAVIGTISIYWIRRIPLKENQKMKKEIYFLQINYPPRSPPDKNGITKKIVIQ